PTPELPCFHPHSILFPQSDDAASVAARSSPSVHWARTQRETGARLASSPRRKRPMCLRKCVTTTVLALCAVLVAGVLLVSAQEVAVTEEPPVAIDVAVDEGVAARDNALGLLEEVQFILSLVAVTHADPSSAAGAVQQVLHLL